MLLVAALLSSMSYNPLEALGSFGTIDLTFSDPSRKREIPARTYLPSSSGKHAVVMFSHGLGGDKSGNAYVGEHLAKRGYVAVHIQHPGSDDSVWRDVPVRERLAAMRRAANATNFRLRVNDVKFVLDRLSLEPKLKDRVDLTKIGMSGHSFGAVTTQALSGQTSPVVGQDLNDARVKAAVIYSPSVTGGKESFGKVSLPWLLMTGTHDISIINDTGADERMAVFPLLPAGDKYQVVFFEAEHGAFTDRAIAGDKLARNPNHHRAILALSTAFWDTYLRGDANAKSWLQGPGAKTVLEGKDRWQTK